MTAPREFNQRLHDRAITLVDRWVLVHCAPDRIVLTQGAMANLADMISVALHETARETGGDATQPCLVLHG